MKKLIKRALNAVKVTTGCLMIFAAGYMFSNLCLDFGHWISVAVGVVVLFKSVDIGNIHI